jgi:hypothetical protein
MQTAQRERARDNEAIAGGGESGERLDVDTVVGIACSEAGTDS